MGPKICILQAVQNISKFVPGTIILGIQIFMTDHANKAWGLNSVGFMNRQQFLLVVCCTEYQASSLPYQQQYIKLGAMDSSRVYSQCFAKAIIIVGWVGTSYFGHTLNAGNTL